MKHQPNRRSFLVASGLTALASTRVLGANDTLRVGVIGAGGRMRSLLNAADQVAGRYQIRGRERRLWAALRRGEMDAPTVSRPPTWIIARCWSNKIDAVFIASPDHWHVRMAVDALEAGKDVYLEKPVTHTLEEGATLTHAVRVQQADSAVRHAAAQLEPLSRRRGSDSGRQPWARVAGQNLLVAELSMFAGAQADRHAGAGLETLARRLARSAVQRRKILSLALVLELWRRRHDRSFHPLDRCGCTGP